MMLEFSVLQKLSFFDWSLGRCRGWNIYYERRAAYSDGAFEWDDES